MFLSLVSRLLRVKITKLAGQECGPTAQYLLFSATGRTGYVFNGSSAQ